MGKVWVLDTETKGTGAQMVPLESVLQKPAPPSSRRVPSKPRPKQRAVEAPEPRQPRRFRVIDVLSRQALVDGADARATVELLRSVRSIVDVTIEVWEPKSGKWRPLTFAESKLLWGFRERVGDYRGAADAGAELASAR